VAEDPVDFTITLSLKLLNAAYLAAALVGWILPDADPVHKVTMIPRGRALGLTVSLPEGDRYTHNREYCLAAMAVRMGGRAAEELIFGSFTTGAADDIQRATGLARKMVCEWGMSDKVGPLTFGSPSEEVFLGRELGMRRTFSDETARTIDNEIRRIIDEQSDRARGIVMSHRDKLDALAKALLERETLNGEEVDRAMSIEPTSEAQPAAPAPAQ
jgi:cell division protease FtsH